MPDEPDQTLPPRAFAERHESAPDGPGGGLNAPAPVLLTIAALIAAHVLRQFLPPRTEALLIETFAVIPARYHALMEGLMPADLPGGIPGLLAALSTHFFLHADWTHLAVNALWLLVFGTPVARYLGGMRFLALALLSAMAGALLFIALHGAEPVILVGASGGISGLMGASLRLIYAGGGTLREGLRADMRAVRPLTLTETFLLPGPRTFILVWLALNAIFGMVGIGAGEGISQIAWEAHMGGFFAGLILLGLLDGRAQRRAAGA